MVKVKLFANFREVAGVKEVEVNARNLGEVIEFLIKKFPEMRELFFDEEGKIKDYVNFMIGGRLVREDEKAKVAEVELGEDDTVSIFPPVSGG